MSQPYSREMLFAYLDDELDDTVTAKIEADLRQSPELRHQLNSLREQRDRGEHSIGAVWRRDRLSCVPREQLNVYLRDAMEPAEKDYVTFHLQTIACPTCLANFEDLKEKQADGVTTKVRRQRYYETSNGDKK